MKADLVLVKDWNYWQELVVTAEKKGYNVLAVGLYHTLVDPHGRHMDSEMVLRWTSEHTPIPPFGFWDFAVGADKTIGGLVLYGYEQGKLAGEIAMQILAGKPPADIPPKVAQRGRYLFSRRQLKKWGLEPYPSIVKRGELIE